jgi:hypothetical protein
MPKAPEETYQITFTKPGLTELFYCLHATVAADSTPATTQAWVRQTLDYLHQRWPGVDRYEIPMIAGQASLPDDKGKAQRPK